MAFDQGPKMMTLLSDGNKSSLFEGVSPGNVGNSFSVPPAQSPGAGLASYGRPVRVLEITGEDRLGEDICVSLFQDSIINQNLTGGAGGIAAEGPCVGLVEFGAGAGLSNFEFDIPMPTIAPGLVQPLNMSLDELDLPVTSRSNGILLSLPASSMRVYVRNDAQSPWLINPAADVFGTPPDEIPNRLNERNQDPAQIRVHATYGRRTAQARLTRTYYICGGALVSPVLETTGAINLGIPPYARRVTFPRQQRFTATSGAITVRFRSNSLGYGWNRGPYAIAAGDLGDLEIQPMDTEMLISSAAAEEIQFLAAVFELGI